MKPEIFRATIGWCVVYQDVMKWFQTKKEAETFLNDNNQEDYCECGVKFEDGYGPKFCWGCKS